MSYVLTVRNNTGGTQNYSFFSANPLVSGGASGQIWSNVLESAPDTPNGGAASLEVSTTYYAICGSFRGKPDQGGKVSISKSVPIKLGSTFGGNITMGSSVALTVTNKKVCDFNAPTNPGAGKVGCFFVDTAVKSQSQDFTMADSTSNNLLIGIGTSKNGSISMAMGTFAPYPNTKYQIAPQAIFFVAAGERFDVGQLMKVEMMGATMAVDFLARQQNDITLIHNPDMTFTFE